jgi:hypothetical protein
VHRESWRSALSGLCFAACLASIPFLEFCSPHRCANHPEASWAAMVLNSLALLASAVIGVAMHEASHALVAWGVGLHVERAVVGVGSTVWKWSNGETDLELRAVPFGGHVSVTAPSGRWLRARLAAVCLAGPLANLVLLAPFLRIFPDGTVCLAHFYNHPHPKDALFLANVILAVSSLVPIPSNDTWDLVSLPFRSTRYLSEYVNSYGAMRAVGLVDAGRLGAAKALIDKVLAQDPQSKIARLVHASVLRDIAREYTPLRQAFAHIAWTSASGFRLPSAGTERTPSGVGLSGHTRRVLGMVLDFGDGDGDESFESTVVRYAYLARRLHRRVGAVALHRIDTAP